MASEMRGFAFAVTFIIIFAGLVSTIPTDFFGAGATPDTPVIPINPNLLTDFTESEDFLPGNFTLGSYIYVLGGREWICGCDGATISVAAKVLFIGLWLGKVEYVKFTAPDGTDRGTSLTMVEIAADATDGEVLYSLQYDESGNTAGGFVVYWNTTTYATPALAWAGNALYLLHGVGMTANTDIASLLIGLLFLQLPDCPFLVNLLIATPIWACIVYVLWYIIKEMIPFL